MPVARKIMQKLWQPRWFMDPSQCGSGRPYAVLVLNRPVSVEKCLAINLWNNASQRVLVDGGANRWLRFCESLTTVENAAISKADMLTGDFDSVNDSTLAKLAAAGTQIIPTPDQNATDYTKALLELRPHIESSKIESVVTLCDTSGRIDHIMANINTMCKALDILPSSANVFALSAESLSWLLPPGEHIIEVPAELVERKSWCSYVPLNGPCTVTTSGFQWDLVNGKTQFGGMVSTSNTYASDRLTICTDGLLYWSMGVSNAPSED